MNRRSYRTLVGTAAVTLTLGGLLLTGSPVAAAHDLAPTHAPASLVRSAKPHPLGPKEERFIDKEAALLQRDLDASTTYGELLTEAGDDTYVIFDSSWTAQVYDVLDEFDAVNAAQVHVHAPTKRTKKIERQYDTMFRETAASAADMRLFLDTYDVAYLNSSSAHITKATTAAHRVTVLTEALTDEVVGNDHTL